MTIKKLSTMPYAQAHVEIDSYGNIALYSYNTLVILIDSNGWLECTGIYSRTTIRHIGAFMREYVKWPNGERGDYFTAKNAYLGGYQLNIKTGEIVEL